VDEPRFAEVRARLATQEKVARWWRDSSLLYFQTFSRMPFPADQEPPTHPLEFYTRYRAQRVPEM
jgi:alpha-glucuronidase